MLKVIFESDFDPGFSQQRLKVIHMCSIRSLQQKHDLSYGKSAALWRQHANAIHTEASEHTTLYLTESQLKLQFVDWM